MNIKGDKIRDPKEMKILEEKEDVITVYDLSGSLFFGTCDKLFNEIEKKSENLCIIFNLKRVNTIDTTGAQLILQIVETIHDKGNHLLFANLDILGDPDKEHLRKFKKDMHVSRPDPYP